MAAGERQNAEGEPETFRVQPRRWRQHSTSSSCKRCERGACCQLLLQGIVESDPCRILSKAAGHLHSTPHPVVRTRKGHQERNAAEADPKRDGEELHDHVRSLRRWRVKTSKTVRGRGHFAPSSISPLGTLEALGTHQHPYSPGSAAGSWRM